MTTLATMDTEDMTADEYVNKIRKTANMLEYSSQIVAERQTIEGTGQSVTLTPNTPDVCTANQKTPKPESQIRCYKCLQEGHRGKSCTSDNKIWCEVCRLYGHTSKNCSLTVQPQRVGNQTTKIRHLKTEQMAKDIRSLKETKEKQKKKRAESKKTKQGQSLAQESKGSMEIEDTSDDDDKNKTADEDTQIEGDSEDEAMFTTTSELSTYTSICNGSR